MRVNNKFLKYAGGILLILILETVILSYVALIIGKYTIIPLGLQQYISYQFFYKVIVIIAAIIVARILGITLYFKLPSRQRTPYLMFMLPLVITATITTIKIVTERQNMIDIFKNLSMALSISIAEDLFSWGIVLVLLLRIFSQISSSNRFSYVILISGVLFAILHLTNFLDQNALVTIIQVIFNLGMGTLLSMTYLRSGSLLIPILIHTTWDFPLIFNKVAIHATMTGHQFGSASLFMTFICASMIVYSLVAVNPNNIHDELKNNLEPMPLLSRLNIAHST